MAIENSVDDNTISQENSTSEDNTTSDENSISDVDLTSKPKGLTRTQKFILGVFGLMVFASVASVVGLAVLNGQQQVTGSTKPNTNCTRLEVGAQPSTGGPAYTQSFVDSDFYGCEAVGMKEEVGIALLHFHKVAVRVSSRDGINFPLTADYSDSRVNLSIMKAVITAYSVG